MIFENIRVIPALAPSIPIVREARVEYLDVGFAPSLIAYTTEFISRKPATIQMEVEYNEPEIVYQFWR